MSGDNHNMLMDNYFHHKGTPPSTEEPEYPYPLVVTKNSEQKSLVVTAYEFGKYLGFLKVWKCSKNKHFQFMLNHSN